MNLLIILFLIIFRINARFVSPYASISVTYVTSTNRSSQECQVKHTVQCVTCTSLENSQRAFYVYSNYSSHNYSYYNCIKVTPVDYNVTELAQLFSMPMENNATQNYLLNFIDRRGEGRIVYNGFSFNLTSKDAAVRFERFSNGSKHDLQLLTCNNINLTRLTENRRKENCSEHRANDRLKNLFSNYFPNRSLCSLALFKLMNVLDCYPKNISEINTASRNSSISVSIVSSNQRATTQASRATSFSIVTSMKHINNTTITKTSKETVTTTTMVSTNVKTKATVATPTILIPTKAGSSSTVKITQSYTTASKEITNTSTYQTTTTKLTRSSSLSTTTFTTTTISTSSTNSEDSELTTASTDRTTTSKDTTTLSTSLATVSKTTSISKVTLTVVYTSVAPKLSNTVQNQDEKKSYSVLKKMSLWLIAITLLLIGLIVPAVGYYYTKHKQESLNHSAESMFSTTMYKSTNAARGSNPSDLSKYTISSGIQSAS